MQRAEPARGAQKVRRGAAAATGRKKAADAAPAKTGRAAPTRKASRPAKKSRTGRKGGRTSSRPPTHEDALRLLADHAEYDAKAAIHLEQRLHSEQELERMRAIAFGEDDDAPDD